MAHCKPCESKLGTGFLPKMWKGTRRSISDGTTLTQQLVRATEGRKTALLKSAWIPASPDEDLLLPLWAVFTGGRRARLFVDGVPEVRRVLEFRNGVDGLEVRLGPRVREFGSGGCMSGRIRQLQAMGTGRQRRSGTGAEAEDFAAAAGGYYAPGTAGARNEQLALAASAGPRHLRERR